MLDLSSPLVGLSTFSTVGFTLQEDARFVLTQVAGTDKDLKKLLGKIPSRVGFVQERNGQQILRIGPHQYWIIGAVPTTAAGVYQTPLSSGRTRFKLSGEKARAVLASSIAIDFHPTQFKPGQFVMTGIHHTPVLVQCIAADVFHIYVLRSFALTVWEWLVDAAQGLS